MKIAVVAIQGNVEEHISSAEKALKEMGLPGEVLPVRHSSTIPTCDAIILPGGESTTLGRLMAREGIDVEIKEAAAAGKPIMGTCAGLVLLAKDGGDQARRTGQHLLGLMDIRAPVIISVKPGIEVLASFDKYIVAAKQGNVIALAFHPELTEDFRIHRYFFGLVK
jgi:5'-phosphate synthase pdxT subunit